MDPRPSDLSQGSQDSRTSHSGTHGAERSRPSGSWTDTSQTAAPTQPSGIVRQFGLKPNDNATVALMGDIEPYRQHLIMDISLVDSFGGRKQIMRAFFNEHGEDCGVLIETTQSSPVAFIHTGLAVSERGEAMVGQRTATIFG